MHTPEANGYIAPEAKKSSIRKWSVPIAMSVLSVLVHGDNNSIPCKKQSTPTAATQKKVDLHSELTKIDTSKVFTRYKTYIDGQEVQLLLHSNDDVLQFSVEVEQESKPQNFIRPKQHYTVASIINLLGTHKPAEDDTTEECQAHTLGTPTYDLDTVEIETDMALRLLATTTATALGESVPINNKGNIELRANMPGYKQASHCITLDEAECKDQILVTFLGTYSGTIEKEDLRRAIHTILEKRSSNEIDVPMTISDIATPSGNTGLRCQVTLRLRVKPDMRLIVQSNLTDIKK